MLCYRQCAWKTDPIGHHLTKHVGGAKETDVGMCGVVGHGFMVMVFLVVVRVGQRMGLRINSGSLLLFLVWLSSCRERKSPRSMTALVIQLRLQCHPWVMER